MKNIVIPNKKVFEFLVILLIILLILYIIYDLNRHYLIVKVIDYNEYNYLVIGEPQSLLDKKYLEFKNYKYNIPIDSGDFKIGDILKIELSYNSEILEIAPAQITHIHKVKKVDMDK